MCGNYGAPQSNEQFHCLECSPAHTQRLSQRIVAASQQYAEYPVFQGPARRLLTCHALIVPMRPALGEHLPRSRDSARANDSRQQFEVTNQLGHLVPRPDQADR